MLDGFIRWGDPNLSNYQQLFIFTNLKNKEMKLKRRHIYENDLYYP